MTEDVVDQLVEDATVLEPWSTSKLTNDRKLEHIRVIQQVSAVERGGNHFDQIQLLHRGLPSCDFDQVDTSTQWLGKTLSCPMIVSSMTGGDHDLLRVINRRLAEAAEETGIGMAVGSQRVMLENSAAEDCFALRQAAPNAVLISNIGAVQLNCGVSVEDCQRAVDVLSADALYLHVNPLQEVIQPEGDTCFAGLLPRMAEVCEGVTCPVLVKEVGCGLSPVDIENCIKIGISAVDVAGRGGTSWSRIEHHRSMGGRQKRCNISDSADLGLLFQDWGLPTPLALKLAAPYASRIGIIASGGIRNGIDMVKAVILGAQICGIARPLLEPAMESTRAVVSVIESHKKAFKTAMFLLGVTSIDRLRGQTQLVVN